MDYEKLQRLREMLNNSFGKSEQKYQYYKFDPQDFMGGFNYEAFNPFERMRRKSVHPDDKPVFEQCKNDAVEYFEPMGIRVGSTHTRVRLDPDTKYRVFLFLKSRKEYYGQHGFIV